MTKLQVFDPAVMTFRHWVCVAESFFQLNRVGVNARVNTAVQRMAPGPTKTWFSFTMNMTEEEKQSWESFKGVMSTVYDSGDHAKVARHKLDSVCMGGTLEEYTQEFMSLLGDVSTGYAMSEQEKVHLFKKGLAPYLKSAATLNPSTAAEFESLADLIQFVSRFDANVAADVKAQHRAPAKEEPALPPVPAPVPVEQVVESALNALFKKRSREEPEDPVRPLRPRCFKCTGFGHRADDCASRQFYDLQGNVTRPPKRRPFQK